MATLKEYEKLSRRERQNRYFSEDFKRRKVSEIERRLTTVSEISREYQVSKGAVYKWIYKFSRLQKRGLKMVVEARSDTHKLILLKEQIKELEQIIGQKQLQIDFLEKLIELAEDKYEIKIKKKPFMKPSGGFGLTAKNSHTK